MSWDIERADEHPHVAIVSMTTNGPNVQNEAFFADLEECFDRLESEYGDCAVVVSGSDPFSAGLDLDYHLPLFADGDTEEIADWYDRYRATNLRLFTYPRPTVAAVDGSAIAGGLILALNCDYRVARRTDAQFSLSEVHIGVPMPAAYVEMIRYAVGTPAAVRSILFGERFDPERARTAGLMHELAAEADVLDRAIAAAANIEPDCYEAYAFSKRAMQARTMDAIDRLALPQDHEALVEAISADGSLDAQARQYRKLRDRDPPWRE